MNLMFYINTISNGGAERVLVNLANQLSERGHECVFVTSFRCPNFEYQLGEKVVRITMSEDRIENSIVRNVKYTFMLRKLIKKYSPDVLVSFMPEANYRALLVTLGLRTKNIISVRNDPNQEYGSRLGKILANTLYRLTDGIVFQTQDAKDWFPDAIKRKGIIIYNQVDDRFYDNKLNTERHDIVAVGRLTNPKNHKMLIDAYAKISGKIGERLLIYGAGYLQKELQEYIQEMHLEDNVKLMGVTDDVIGVLNQAKLFVLSSNYEGMPNALMEAMAVGLACISTDCPCGGPRMLFGEDLKEYLVPVNNSDSMSEVIYEILSDDNKREAIGQRCKQRANAFRPSVIIENWDSYIHQVASI